MNVSDIIFDPLLPLPVLYSLAGGASLLLVLAIWRRLSGWWLRALAFSVLLLGLLNPSLQQEDRETLTDIVVMIIDETSSQKLSDRQDQTAQAVEDLTRDITARGMELRVVKLPDGKDDAGSEMMQALNTVLAEEPRARIAGTVLVTDGQVHDMQRAPSELEAPLHTLLTGHKTDWDRRLVIKNAPAFAILDEEIKMVIRVEDQGKTPADLPQKAPLTIAIDGGPPQEYTVPVGQDLEVPVKLTHGGMNILQFELAPTEGELTNRNNSAVVQINGVRDRLRVLLISGEPHAGERTWRNLLKSDSAVDLVHFTILRPPEKQDGVPVSELSLIAFPTRELFLEKIDEFDLIIFDRYKRRGILPPVYFDSIRQYVEKGGAVLVAAGPDFASANSIHRSPLGQIMPVNPTARVLEQGYTPLLSEIGKRHPVTEGLEKLAPAEPKDGIPGWGRWMRQIEVNSTSGHIVMTGIEDKPLLTLDRVGEGRIAILASDHAWLWNRGFEGGGPQLELLRRLAHWMMKEPDLEEETLSARIENKPEGQSVIVTRRTLDTETGEVEITGPDGSIRQLALKEISPGRFEGEFSTTDLGLYRLKEGEQEIVIALGPMAPREFVETVATGDKLAGLVKQTQGGIFNIEDGIPDIRLVGEGRNASGRGWIGITPRNAYLTTNITLMPLVSVWLFVLLAVLMMLGAWLREGRQ